MLVWHFGQWSIPLNSILARPITTPSHLDTSRRLTQLPHDHQPPLRIERAFLGRHHDHEPPQRVEEAHAITTRPRGLFSPTTTTTSLLDASRGLTRRPTRPPAPPTRRGGFFLP